MLYYSRRAAKKTAPGSQCYMCFYFYNAVVCESKEGKQMSMKCIIQFVNTLNKKTFYVWSTYG